MSLEIAVTDGKYAVVVSDGLAWNAATGAVTDENSPKQIVLGREIVVAAGGFVREVDELFSVCGRAYNSASADRAAAVKSAFQSYIGSKPFTGFGETILGGLLVAKQPEGFLLVRQNGNREHEEYFIKPGDEPRAGYLTPTGRILAVCMMAMRRAVTEPMKSGASPAQIVGNLRAIFHAAAQVEDPPKLNENLRVSILGDVPAEEPSEPDVDLVLSLSQFVEQMREALSASEGESVTHPKKAGALRNNAITGGVSCSIASPVTVGTSLMPVGSISIASVGGQNIIWVSGIVIEGSSSSPVSITLYKGSATGTPLGATRVDSLGSNQRSPFSLLGRDTSPANPQLYTLAAQQDSVGSAMINNTDIVGVNFKK